MKHDSEILHVVHVICKYHAVTLALHVHGDIA